LEHAQIVNTRRWDYRKPSTTAECWLIRKGAQTDKAFLRGDRDPVLITGADPGCRTSLVLSDDDQVPPPGAIKEDWMP
jgi:hypothetical protein